MTPAGQVPLPPGMLGARPTAAPEQAADPQSKAAAQKEQAFRDWLWHYGRMAVTPAVILVVLGCAITGATMVMAWLVKVIIDSAFTTNTDAPGSLNLYTGTERLLYLMVGAMAGAFLIRTALRYGKGYAEQYFGFKLDAQVNRDFYLHILRLPRNVKSQHANDDYTYHLMHEASAVSALLLGSAVSAIQSVCSVIIIFVTLLTYSPGLALLSIAVSPFMYMVAATYVRRRKEQDQERHESDLGVQRFMNESIRGSNVIQAYNRERTHHEHYFGMQTFKYQLRVREMLNATNRESFTLGIAMVAGLLVLGFGGAQVFNGLMSMGELVVFVLYIALLPAPLAVLNLAWATYRDQLSDTRTVFDYIYDLPEQLNATDRPQVLQRAKGQVIFQNVTVYAGKKPILLNVNLTVQPGQKVALIGPAGSGKSTLLCLPPRLNTWTSGNVYLDGVEVRQAELDSLRRQFAYVEQEPTIFSDSVFGNVAFGKPEGETNLAEATAALGAASAYDYVKALPHGFDTVIGDGGQALTIGQRQRISLARVYLRDSPILLLDEPVSSHDPAQDALVTSLIELMKDRTTLLASHNLRLLQQMDAIYVIEQGILRDVSEYGGIEAYYDVLMSQRDQRQLPKTAPAA